MKIQRFGFDYNDDKGTIVFVCNDGEMINYKDHEAKMQQAMRIIKKLRGERQEFKDRLQICENEFEFINKVCDKFEDKLDAHGLLDE